MDRTATLVSAAEASSRTGLAQQPASLLAWYPESRGPGATVNLDHFTAAAPQAPDLPPVRLA